MADTTTTTWVTMNGAAPFSSASKYDDTLLNSVLQEEEEDYDHDAAEPPSIPARNTARHGLANDVRLGPASPAAMTNILSSFSTYSSSIPDIYDEPVGRSSSLRMPRPPPPISQTRPPAVDVFQPADRSFSMGSRSNEYVYSGSAAAGEGEDDDDLAAEAPVVPTSRSTSGLIKSKNTSPKVTRFHRPFRNNSGILQSSKGPRPAGEQQLPQGDDGVLAPPDILTIRPQKGRVGRTFSLTSVNSQRPPVNDGRRPGPPSAYPLNAARSMRSVTGGRFSQFGTPSVASPQSTSQVSRRASFDEEDEIPDSGPSRYPTNFQRRQSEPQNNNSIPDRILSSKDSAHGASPAKAPVPTDIPLRTSSMRRRDGSSFLERARNALSERASREHVKGSKVNGRALISVSPYDEDGAENNVLRRIKELNLAKERRHMKTMDGSSRPATSASTSNTFTESFVPASAAGEEPLVDSDHIYSQPRPATADAARQAELMHEIVETQVVLANGVDVQQPLNRHAKKQRADQDVAGAGEDTETIARNKPFRALSLRAASLKGISSRPSIDGPGYIRAKTPTKSPNSSRPNSRSSSRNQKRSRNQSPSAASRASTTLQSRYSTLIEERTSIDSINEAVADFLQAPRLSQRISILNRQVAFSEVGDPQGRVIFCCVGMGMNRYITAFYDDLAGSLGLRLITLDRPGIGDSEPYAEAYKPPLSWPDDVDAVCELLNISSFSLLAHSAGSIYALATAIRFRERVKGRIHLLAPWIPPSQLSTTGLPESSQSRTGHLPRSQRLLRLLPSSLLKLTGSFNLAGNPKNTTSGKAAPAPKLPRKSTDTSLNYSTTNSSFITPRPSMMARRNEVPRIPSTPQSPIQTFAPTMIETTSPPQPPQSPQPPQPPQPLAPPPPPPATRGPPAHLHRRGPAAPSATFGKSRNGTRPTTPRHEEFNVMTPSMSATSSTPASPGRASFFSREGDPAERSRRYDVVLTPSIWQAANRNANPAIDLLVCLERKQTIGFRYVDVDAGKGIVIHHGSKDARVPLENIQWLAKFMRKVEVRVVEGQGHSLMANAAVMGAVLTEMSNDSDASIPLSLSNSGSGVAAGPTPPRGRGYP